ncbi:hypothetical protein LI328DRAFT_158841 [Trichoderma asperelloides]|nr:hypothetical protein LI328DRAFT_158841 [Trichoderma asperelloides]
MYHHAAPLSRHPSAQWCLQRSYTCYFLPTCTYPHTHIHTHRIASYVHSIFPPLIRDLLLQAFAISVSLLIKPACTKSVEYGVAGWHLQFSPRILSYHFLHITFPLNYTRPNLCPRSGSEAHFLMTCLHAGSHIVRLTFGGTAALFKWLKMLVNPPSTERPQPLTQHLAYLCGVE